MKKVLLFLAGYVAALELQGGKKKGNQIVQMLKYENPEHLQLRVICGKMQMFVPILLFLRLNYIFWHLKNIR